jgi:enoyl-CoA hydratase
MIGDASFSGLELTRSGRVAVLELATNKVNALDRDVFDQITAVVAKCEDDPDVGSLVVTGKGSVFSAGLDVSQVLANDISYTTDLLDSLETALTRLFLSPLPTVAAVNGAAIAGGCLLACTCDKRLIAEEARIGVTELKVGVSFPVMTVELLGHVCGPDAERLMFDAVPVDAADACRFGLAHQSFPGAELRAAALSEAERLASLDRESYALAKETSRRATFSEGIPEVEELESRVRNHWCADGTRASLGRLLAPK